MPVVQPRDYFACILESKFHERFQGSRLGFEFKRGLYPLGAGVELSGLRMRKLQVPLKIISGHVRESSFHCM